MKRIALLFTFLIMALVPVYAQVVTTSPAFPIDGNGNVTITFHADQGNMGLNNYTGDVYIHTGVILQGQSGWQHVVTTWGSTNAAWKMTSLGNNTYTYTITDIRTWYGVLAGQVIDSLAMLFRDGAGNTVGRATGGGDIFVEVIQAGGLSGSFTAPAQQPYYKQAAQSLSTTFLASSASTISIYLNNVLQTTTPNAITVNSSFTGTAGVNWVKGVATDGTTTVTDSFYFVNVPAVNVADVPAGLHDGVNYIDNQTVTLVLVAPGKNYVCVSGEFNNWITGLPYFMNKTSDGNRWWVTISGLTAQQQYAYQYIVDGTLKVADPYAELILDPDNDSYITADVYPNLKAYPTGKTSGIVSVLQTGKPAYNWTASNYVKPAKNNLIIYELLIRDFIAGHHYQQLIDTLPYLKTLGINAIELMPFNEFEGNNSWGYNPDFYFAPDKYYGTSDKLKAFIDACHNNNIAVIMDMVLNHSFGQSPMCQLYWDSNNLWPTADNPWFNTDCNTTQAGYQGKHPYGVGYDFNHESLFTKKFVADVTHYWVNEFKIDGYRFDLSKGFTQKYTGDDVTAWGHYDSSRIAIWKGYADSIWSQDPSTYIILEHFADNDEETVLANYGMMLWSNFNYAYAQSAMGYPTTDADLGGMSYVNKGWQNPQGVGYMESHDEERVMYKCLNYGAQNGSGSYKIKELNTGLNRIKLNATFFFTIPGPKMLWQFEELGYDSTINSGGGRTEPKAILWSYYNIPARKAVYTNFKSLIYLKKTYPAAFNTSQFTMNVGNTALRSINLNDTSMQVLAAGNFGTSKDSNSVTFAHTGWWYEYFTGDSLNVTNVATKLSMNAGDYKLYLSKKITPPDGVVGIKDMNEPKAKLFHNYPNPFSSTSTVEFYMPHTANALLELYDMEGRRVDVIADKTFGAGNYSFELNAAHLKSGVYYVTLDIDGQKSSIAVTVLK